MFIARCTNYKFIFVNLSVYLVYEKKTLRCDKLRQTLTHSFRDKITSI